MDVASGPDRLLDITFGLQVCFRTFIEAFNHPYIYFFHLSESAIGQCGSTLYVGLARIAPPTNTNFRLTFLLTRIRRLSTKTYLYTVKNGVLRYTFAMVFWDTFGVM